MKIFGPQPRQTSRPLLDEGHGQGRVPNQESDEIERAHHGLRHDVDGTTSVAMVSSFLKGSKCLASLHPDALWRRPWGVAQRGNAKVSGYMPIITLDCGTKDLDALAAAAEGIDTIVCDHLPAETLPVTHALLNQTRRLRLPLP